MQISTAIVVLCLFSVGYTNGQGESLLGLPLDYDEARFNFGQDLQNDGTLKEEDIWTEENTEQLSEKIKALCQEYDLFLDGQSIDCNNIKLEPKALKIAGHNLQKRDAGEEPVEGSGEGEPPAEDGPPETAPEALVEPKAEGDPAADKLEETAPGALAEPKEEEPNAEEGNVGEPKTAEAPVEESKVEEPKPDEPEVEEPTPDEPVSPSEESTTVEQKPSEEVAVAVSVDQVDAAPKPEVAGETTGEGGKKRRKLESGVKASPDDLAEVETSRGKEAEDLNDHQSGNALMDVQKGSSSVEGSDIADVQRKMDPNADIKAKSEEPKSGESTTEGQTGRKDTTILIVLFAAVVVVGLAAFGYKMVVQKKKNAERAENGHVTASVAADRADPERGTEMKPLMKPVVEYNDENKAESK